MLQTVKDGKNNQKNCWPTSTIQRTLKKMSLSCDYVKRLLHYMKPRQRSSVLLNSRRKGKCFERGHD